MKEFSWWCRFSKIKAKELNPNSKNQFLEILNQDTQSFIEYGNRIFYVDAAERLAKLVNNFGRHTYLVKRCINEFRRI